ncbi:hypothetical protein DPMN_045803 [Dreissena polymorpha]|uniref:Uncharacterized protein n=1 Tax=Dreissena polymorpha TaxID=45954 RepID=A0A9D4D4T3_DREPO|nr:hypothetical protein DPMN_045803 [Dreissena polymorpha]
MEVSTEKSKSMVNSTNTTTKGPSNNESLLGLDTSQGTTHCAILCYWFDRNMCSFLTLEGGHRRGHQ